MVKKSASATDEVHWLNLRYTETQCPGLHQALESAPNDQLSALARGIIYQWFLHHQQAGTLTKAVVATLAGPGATGQRSLRRSSRPRKTLRAWHRWRLCRQTIARRWRASRRRPSLKIRCPFGFAGSTEAPPPVREISRLSSPPASAPALPQISMEQPSTMGKIPATIKMNRWTKPRTRCSRSSIK
jgi:hypothetical protein